MVNNFYVYKHIDDDGSVVYIGKGRYSRAWRHEKRQEEHSKWMAEQLPLLKVEFAFIGCTEEQAYLLEKQLIEKLKPKYNLDHTAEGLARRKSFGKWLSNNHSRFYDKNLQKELGKRAAQSEKHPNNKLFKCVHCGAEMNLGHISRYHNNNCKKRVEINDLN
jgi:excinuclease UvrABC nuclease subunit